MIPPQAALLPDGRRLHLQNGPIDLVIEAFGARDEIAAAYRQAMRAFPAILPCLVEELPRLRRRADADLVLEGQVARRMLAAVLPHAGTFITPMAAVAGAVADEILDALLDGRHLSRAYVNNGGDIALYLAPGSAFEIGLVAETVPSGKNRPALDGIAHIPAASPVRGVATSGWGGRSFSLGIADAVTVLARGGAAADAAATLIANAVTLDHPSVRRARARDLDPDSDLGEMEVTVAVGDLAPLDIARALERGRREAEKMRGRGLIVAACLSLKGHHRLVGAEGLVGAKDVRPLTILPPAEERKIACSRSARSS